MKYSPVALFIFNRPEHTRLALQSLQESELAEKTNLFIFSDGPRTQNDVEKINETRALFDDLKGFKSVQLIAREENRGLANNIVAGVSELLQDHESVIVLEDDLVLSKYFLTYMNDALNKYRDDEQVCSIHGYSFPTQQPLPNLFFLKGADCWGWATWRNAWASFEPDGKKLLDDILSKGLSHEFDMEGVVAYTQMLRDQVAGKNNSWAIRWHASTFLKNQLCLFSGQSLVNNIGNDNSGQHCETTDAYSTEVAQKPINLDDIPVAESLEAKEIIKSYYRSIKPSLFSRVVVRLKKELGLAQYAK